jgi:arylsulfatase A-like enzyme
MSFVSTELDRLNEKAIGMANPSAETNQDRFEVRATAESHFSWLRTRLSVERTLRTGLTKVGLPGAKLGLQPEDPTIAEMLKPQGYVCGQFGKNHLGDRDEFLPTVHGFDEFFGNLYHLNAEEEPENEDYPKNPEFKKKFGPRGVLHSWANPDGTQKIEDTGPLTKKRMETVDGEFLDGSSTRR